MIEELKKSIENNGKPYYLVTFEGPAGSGKTYHSKCFAQYLEQSSGMHVDYIANPFRLNTLGKQTYDLMVSDRFSTPEQYALISLLNRNLLQSYIKKKVLEGNKLFVVDRWNLSFWTHQIIASDMIKSNPVFATWALQYPDEIVPDVQFLLAVDEEELENRLVNRNPNEKLNRYEKQKYSEKVRFAYRDYLKNNKDYIAIIVKENEEKENVFKNIITNYEKLICR